jgi:hypothetical protein
MGQTVKVQQFGQYLLDGGFAGIGVCDVLTE